MPAVPPFRPLASYAPIGDGRTVALIGTDGCIDWLPSAESSYVIGETLNVNGGMPTP